MLSARTPTVGQQERKWTGTTHCAYMLSARTPTVGQQERKWTGTAHCAYMLSARTPTVGQQARNLTTGVLLRISGKQSRSRWDNNRCICNAPNPTIHPSIPLGPSGRLNARYMNHCDNTQPNLIMHYISHSIPPSPLHPHTRTHAHPHTRTIEMCDEKRVHRLWCWWGWCDSWMRVGWFGVTHSPPPSPPRPSPSPFCWEVIQHVQTITDRELQCLRSGGA